MAEAASQATVSYDDQLWIGREDGGSTTWMQVFGVEEVAMPENTPDDIDVTHQQSPGRTKETIPGMLAAADYSQDMQYWPADPGQVALDELAELSGEGTQEYVKFAFVVGGVQRTYRGYVKTFTPTATVGEKRMASLTAAIFNRLENETLPGGGS